MSSGINEFRFQVCSRCGHPPSDGPCKMGNEEHADTWEKGYAAFSIAADLTRQLQAAEAANTVWTDRAIDAEARALAAEKERDELLAALQTATAISDSWQEQYTAQKHRLSQLRTALEEARAELLTYIQGESGLPFTEPYKAVRTALEKHIDPALATPPVEGDTYKQAKDHPALDTASDEQ